MNDKEIAVWLREQADNLDRPKVKELEWIVDSTAHMCSVVGPRINYPGSLTVLDSLFPASAAYVANALNSFEAAQQLCDRIQRLYHGVLRYKGAGLIAAAKETSRLANYYDETGKPREDGGV